MTWVGRAARPRRARVWLATVAVTMLATAAPAACTGEEDPTIPTAGGATTTPVATGDDPLAQELAFVACMREEGIEDMPDPVPGDTSGRSAVRYAIDVLGKGSDPVFQAALEECRDLLPEPPAPEPPSAERLEALRQFSECMRNNGLPDFPDMDGDSIFFGVRGRADVPAVSVNGDIVSVNLDLPVVAAAMDACRDLFPADSDEAGAR